jgi:hypothetical protein
MGRIFGLGMIVVALWVALTLYTGGVESLTGRVDEGLGPASNAQADSKPRPITQRFGDAVDAEMRKRERQYAERLDDL